MAHVQFIDVQDRPLEFLDLTSLTLDEFQQLVPPFEAAFQAHMAAWRLDGKPRTARRFTVYNNCPLPTPEDRLTQVDVGATFVEAESFKLDGLRTSLIVDPENGMLPPLLPAAQARLAARPKRSFEDPETFGLAERCLVGIFGLGGSTASPPMVPSEVVPAYYQIVQTDAHVLIYAEWIHDARIIRLNGTHRPAGLRRVPGAAREAPRGA